MPAPMLPPMEMGSSLSFPIPDCGVLAGLTDHPKCVNVNSAARLADHDIGLMVRIRTPTACRLCARGDRAGR